jgi:hypothetical protein
MEVEQAVQKWKFKQFLGENDVTKTLAQVRSSFVDESATNIESWMSRQPSDGEYVLQHLPSNKSPLFVGRCFSTWDVNTNSLSGKKNVISGEFLYDTFVGKGMVNSLFGSKSSFTAVQRVDALFCHRCLAQHGLYPSKPLDALKILNGQTSSLIRHMQSHDSKPKQIEGFTSDQYDRKV